MVHFPQKKISKERLKMTNIDEQNTTDVSSNEAKRLKLENEKELSNFLSDFEYLKTLNDDSVNKLFVIQAVKKTDKTSDSEQNVQFAVLIFQKPHFTLDAIVSYFSQANESEISFQNDIYHKLSIFPSKQFNSNLNFFFSYCVL